MLLTSVIVIITLCLLLALLSMIWPPDSPWSPWWRTNAKTAHAIIKLARITKEDTLYDLGCGDGTVLVTAGSKKGSKGVGVEIDPARVFIARCRIYLHNLQSNIVIKRGDLFKQDISKASVVIVYLVPKTLKRLEGKFLKELRPGTRVVSYVYPIKYLTQIASDKEYQLYVYEIPPKKSANTGKN